MSKKKVSITELKTSEIYTDVELNLGKTIVAQISGNESVIETKTGDVVAPVKSLYDVMKEKGYFTKFDTSIHVDSFEPDMKNNQYVFNGNMEFTTKDGTKFYLKKWYRKFGEWMHKSEQEALSVLPDSVLGGWCDDEEEMFHFFGKKTVKDKILYRWRVNYNRMDLLNQIEKDVIINLPQKNSLQKTEEK